MTKRRVSWAAAATLLALTLAMFFPSRPTAAEEPIVKIHDGRHWTWYARADQYREHKADIEGFYEYADRAFETLCDAWQWKPARDRFALLVWPQTGGGFATGDVPGVSAVAGSPQSGIGVSYDAFFNEVHGIKGYWGFALITHEMVNIFTAETVSGGWPVDWWANHRSPFPMMTAVEVETVLRPDVAMHHAQGLAGPIERMFVRLKDQYGWCLFRRAFAEARADGIDWSKLGPNPGPLLTNYVAAYLQLGAPEDLTPLLRGSVPDFEPDAAAAIGKARSRWRDLPLSDPRRAELQQAFRRGEYAPK